jgi:hypothetical protein
VVGAALNPETEVVALVEAAVAADLEDAQILMTAEALVEVVPVVEV